MTDMAIGGVSNEVEGICHDKKYQI